MRAVALLLLSLGAWVSCTHAPRFNPEEAPDVEAFRRMTLNLMAPWEHKLFKNLPQAQACRAFMDSFWAMRDPDPSTEENEFRQIMEERYMDVQSMSEGALPGWKTDRGRMYQVLGPPDRIETPVGFRESSSLKGLIYWIYGAPGAREEILRFTDTEGLGVYHLDTFESSISLLSRIRELQGVHTFSARPQDPIGPLKVRASWHGEALHLELPWEDLTLTRMPNRMLEVRILILLRSMKDGSVLLRQERTETIQPDSPRQTATCHLSIPMNSLPAPCQVLVRDLNGKRMGLTRCKP